MTKKKLFLIIGGLLILIVLAMSILQWQAKDRVASFLTSKIPTHLLLEYGSMDVNILTGTVVFQAVNVALSNKDTLLVHTNITTDVLEVKGFGYWQFLMNNTIKAEEIILQRPSLSYRPHFKLEGKDTVSHGLVKLLKTIKVDRIQIKDGQFSMHKGANDSVLVRVPHIDFTLYDAKTDPFIIKRKIPITYSSYSASADSVFVDLGEYETLLVASLRVEENRILIEDLSLNSKFDKSALSRHTPIERDHITLTVPSVAVNDLNYGFMNNRLFVSANDVMIMGPHLAVYRDKLLPDDTSIKRMYSQALRELPLDVKIPKLQVQNGYVIYEELITTETSPGKLFFDPINVVITGLCNKNDTGGATEIAVKGNMMGQAALELDWSFDVNATNDSFLASGNIQDFQSQSANSFLRSNMRSEAEGIINRMYFTISGNTTASTGDMKMKYHDFKFNILEKDRAGVNKILTAIGNIFVNDGSNVDTDGFRHGTISVNRDPTKSFFNYLWLNVRDGILKTITGDGKKED